MLRSNSPIGCRSRLVCTLFWCLLVPSSPTFARPDKQKPNAREACRQAVAGAYLESYDNRERLKTYIRALDQQIVALDAALASAQVEVDKVAKQAAAKTFDVNIAVRQDELATTTRTLEARASEAREQRRAAGTDLDQHVAAEKAMRTTIERVFVFTRVDDKPDGGYPMSLNYKAGCPKFRYLCPLPLKDVEELLKIEVAGAPLEECRRYAGLSRLR